MVFEERSHIILANVEWRGLKVILGKRAGVRDCGNKIKMRDFHAQCRKLGRSVSIILVWEKHLRCKL